jgi:protein phosphatase
MAPHDRTISGEPADTEPAPGLAPGQASDIRELGPGIRRIDAHGLSDRGRVRERNEDQFLIAVLRRNATILETSLTSRDITEAADQGALLMVADGMGAYEGGELASAAVIEAMSSYAVSAMAWTANGSNHDIERGLSGALEGAARKIRELARMESLDERMGTTFTMAYLSHEQLHVMHAGDSRCYLLRDHHLWRLTRDHTVAQELVEGKLIAEHDARYSPYRHVLSNAVSGDIDEVRADFQHVQVRVGDRIMLCSDGLTTTVDDERIRDILAENRPVDATAEHLVAAANAAGGPDNVTVIVARL